MPLHMQLHGTCSPQHQNPNCSCLPQVKAEKPAWHLGVISGALLRTMEQVASGSAHYMGFLEKGQLPPAQLSLTQFQHSFVLDGAPFTPCP